MDPPKLQIKANDGGGEEMSGIHGSRGSRRLTFMFRGVKAAWLAVETVQRCTSYTNMTTNYTHTHTQ